MWTQFSPVMLSLIVVRYSGKGFAAAVKQEQKHQDDCMFLGYNLHCLWGLLQP